jgi:hypothetical protein
VCSSDLFLFRRTRRQLPWKKNASNWKNALIVSLMKLIPFSEVMNDECGMMSDELEIVS